MRYHDFGPLEGKTANGEWKFVDEDWSEYTMQQRQGIWLRTWNGVRQVLRWIPAQSQDTSPATEPEGR